MGMRRPMAKSKRITPITASATNVMIFLFMTYLTFPTPVRHVVLRAAIVFRHAAAIPSRKKAIHPY